MVLLLVVLVKFILSTISSLIRMQCFFFFFLLSVLYFTNPWFFFYNSSSISFFFLCVLSFNFFSPIRALCCYSVLLFTNYIILLSCRLIFSPIGAFCQLILRKSKSCVVFPPSTSLVKTFLLITPNDLIHVYLYIHVSNVFFFFFFFFFFCCVRICVSGPCIVYFLPPSRRYLGRPIISSHSLTHNNYTGYVLKCSVKAWVVLFTLCTPPVTELCDFSYGHFFFLFMVISSNHVISTSHTTLWLYR